MNNEGWYIKARIVRWVADEPWPGIVEFGFPDAAGRNWSFIDKYPVVTAAACFSTSDFPIPAIVGCEIISESRDSEGKEIVRISTERPWGISATDGTDQFIVLAQQLMERPASKG